MVFFSLGVFGRRRGALEPKQGEWGEMSGEEAIPCPSGPGAPYIDGDQLHVSPNKGTQFSQKTGKP